MASKKTERVSVYVPRERTEEDPNLFVGINGRNYLVPKGKTSQVPPEVAAELARADMEARAERERALLEGFVEDLRARLPALRPLGEGARRHPGLVALLLPGLSSERAIAALDLKGVEVSGGAACASREAGVSHVYRAMGLSERDAACVLRISIGRGTTEKDLRAAAEAMEDVYKRERA